MTRLNILIVTSKWSTKDSDGGMSTVADICETLSQQCNLDVLTELSFVNQKCDGVKNIYGFDIPELLKENYNGKNKFQTRILISHIVGSVLDPMIDRYDKVIVLHVFHLFEICKKLASDKAKKIILFPMMLTPSYVACNENVPNFYTCMEKMVLKNVGKIITPSVYEKLQITDYFNIPVTKIALVPRYVRDIFSSHTHFITSSERCEICYIASIKKQKHNIIALELLHTLLSNGINTKLHIVGAIHDKEVYNEMLEYIEVNDIQRNVVYHGVISQSSISTLFRNVTFAISVSLCETFGRSVMEGLVSGLPTIVMNYIACLGIHNYKNKGVIRVESTKEMADAIIYYLHNPVLYSKLSSSAIEFGKQYRRVTVQPILENELMR